MFEICRENIRKIPHFTISFFHELFSLPPKPYFYCILKYYQPNFLCNY